MKEYERTDRIGSELQRALSEILRAEVRDPRLGLITIQEVRVTRDLAHAKVFFTCFGSAAEGRDRESLLNRRLAGFLRHELGRRVKLRTTPELQFSYDESVEAGERLSSLIERAATTGGAASQSESTERENDGT